MLAQAVMQVAANAPLFAFTDFKNLLLESGQPFLVRFARRDVGADGDVFNGFVRFVEERKDRRVHPVERTIFRAVLDFAMPHLAAGNRAPQIGEEALRMVAGIDDPMVLAEQFLAGIFGNLAKLVVHVGDVARSVGDGHDRMSVERGLDVAELVQRGLHTLLGLLARAVARFQRLQSLDQFRFAQAGVVVHSSERVYRSSPVGMKQNPSGRIDRR